MSTPAIANAARTRVDRIKTGVEVVWSLIVESYQARDWESLGYGTWDEMCTREFGTSRLRLPREERAETIGSLRDAGLSLRAIAAVTGNSKDTVARALVAVSPETPDVDVVEPHGFAEKIAAELAASDVDHAATAESISGPAKVTGIDGKSYSPAVQRAPYRKSLPDVARAAGFELRKATERIERLVSDDRYRANEKQVADAMRGHLLYVAETVAAVLDQLP